MMLCIHSLRLAMSTYVHHALTAFRTLYEVEAESIGRLFGTNSDLAARFGAWREGEP